MCVDGGVGGGGVGLRLKVLKYEVETVFWCVDLLPSYVLSLNTNVYLNILYLLNYEDYLFPTITYV